MKRYIALLSVLALTIACQKENFEQNNTFEFSEYTAITEDAPTKTSLDAELNVLWTQDDRVSIFDGNSTNVQYKVTDASAGKTSAELEIVSSSGYTAGTELSNNIGYYPYNSGTSIAKGSDGAYELSVTLPATQSYAANSFGQGAYPMVSVTSSTSDKNLAFKNICGALKLQLTGTAKIKRICLSGNNSECLAGATIINAKHGENPEITTTGSVKTVVLNCGDNGVQLNDITPTNFLIVLPTITFSNGFTVHVYDIDGNVMEIKTTKEKTIERAKILKMAPVAYSGAPQSITNLSASGTANCYIVPSAGTYKFKATVKGNSEESIGTPSKAVVLWESYGSSVTPERGGIILTASFAGDYITFETPIYLSEGNAVIGVQNADDEILWSWHIWLCEDYDPISCAHVYNNDAGTMMDRNLGALHDNNLGMLYQWGRKDPMLNSRDFPNQHLMQVRYEYPSMPVTVASTEATGTISYSVKNPATFITSYDKDWLYESSELSNTRWTSEKSKYDPCPYGWRVPDGGENGIWATALSKTSNFTITSGVDWFGEDQFSGINFGSENSSPMGTSDYIYYPAGGYRYGYDNIKYNTSYSFHYWSCTEEDDYALAFEATTNGGKTYIVNVVPSVGRRPANAYSVRCMKIE